MVAKVVSMNNLASDVASGALPNVTFIDTEADLSLSEHPPGNVTTGEAWSHTVISEIQAGPGWPNTAIVLTWDENGGFYDHVPPPQVDEWGYGFRVPLIAVSPYAKHASVDHAIMDHASMLRFIEDNWGLPYLTHRVDTAGNLTSAFAFASTLLSARSASAPAPGQSIFPTFDFLRARADEFANGG